MRFRDHSQMAKAEIQLAPLIDVVFILLMFFVVTWNFARKEAERVVTTGEPCISCNYPRTVTVAMRIDRESMSDTVTIFDGR